MIGQIVASLNASDFAPVWLLCDGRRVSQTAFPDLFAVIGHDYALAGDDQNDGLFRLPNLVGCVLRGGPVADVGGFGGIDQIALTLDHLPEHSHALRATDNGPDNDDPEGRVLAESQDDLYTNEVDDLVNMHEHAIGPAGNATPTPIPIVPKHVVVSFYVRALNC